jgi:hypothetical protein
METKHSLSRLAGRLAVRANTEKQRQKSHFAAERRLPGDSESIRQRANHRFCDVLIPASTAVT